MKVAVIYNKPAADRYQVMGEDKAESGVIDEVRAVKEALDELNYPSILIPLRPPLEHVRYELENLKADIVFNLFEGFEGKPEPESKVAGMMGKLKIPFTVSPSPALALALTSHGQRDF
jgi:D-alanine-D-alanine ligase